MIALRTVLCPVDFSPATARQVDLAADVARAFNARLILHHNRHSLGTGASVGWMWHADRQWDTQETLEEKLRVCASRVGKEVTVEPLLTEGPVSRSVLTVVEAVDADLTVLTAHGTAAEDHASITERMLEHGRRAVLILHEPVVERRTPHFAANTDEPQILLVPTDLTSHSESAVQTGFELARAVPVDLHLLHVVPGGSRAPSEQHMFAQETKLRALVPEDLAGRVRVHVQHGDPAREIPRLADLLNASCILMGEHARTPLRRWLGRETSRVVLHQAHCPVWYVPGAWPHQAAPLRVARDNTDLRRSV